MVYTIARDGDALENLSNGLTVIRRRKHEWTRQLALLKRRELARETDRVRGSKFLWTLSRYVEWVREKIAELQWNSKTAATAHTFVEDNVVGYSNGQPTHKIR